jgi:endoglucanase
MHTASEVVSLKDLDEIAELLARFVLSVDEQTNVIP